MTEPSGLQTFSAAIAKLVADAAPSIVAVVCKGRRTSGFVWKPGLIVTADEALGDDGDIEVTLAGGTARGVAVHVAARVAALAGPSEVLVTATTHDSVDGSGLEFADRGSHDLKGLRGARAVFALCPAAH